MPSDSIAVSSALKTTNFPYGMPMNLPKGQVGPSTGVVGANAIVVHPIYTNTIASVPQVTYVHDSVDDDRMSELDGFEASYTSVSMGLVYRLRALGNHSVLFPPMFLISD